MTALREAVAAKRHDPVCSAELRPEAFTHIPHPVDARPVPALLTGAELLLDQRFKAAVHSYTEWLHFECEGHDEVTSTDWIASVPLRMPERLAAATVAQVVHLQRTTRDPRVFSACRSDLERRWAASEDGRALRESLADPPQQDGAA
ncbi:MAG: hypothetical protein ACK4PH_05850 [Aquincola tertiaricarbonis]